jgi:hypothetical protein
MRVVAGKGVVAMESARVLPIAEGVRGKLAQLRGAYVQACGNLHQRLHRPELTNALPTLIAMGLGAAGDLAERLCQLAETPSVDHRVAARDALLAQMRALLLTCSVLEIDPEELLIELADERPGGDPTRDLLERCRAALTLGMGPRMDADNIATVRALTKELGERLRRYGDRDQ